MTEAEPPAIPVTNGTKDYTDIEKLHARIQAAIEKTNEPPVSSPKIQSNTDSIPSVVLEEPAEHHEEIYGEEKHKSSLTHEVTAGAAAFETYEQEDHHTNHALAKEMLVGLAAAEADKLKKLDESGLLDDQPLTPANTTINVYENGEVMAENDLKECYCQELSVVPGTARCNKCEKVVPALVDLHKQRLQQLDDLEVANNRIKEEFDKVERQNDEIEKLRKRVEELEDQIDVKTDEFAALQKDMAILNDKFVDEITKVAELQHSKEVVEGELEELSRVLFEQANGMVASAAKERYDLEVQQKVLEKQLKETQERLMAESSQLKELREKMEQLVQNQPQPESKRSSSSDPSFRASIDFAELFGLREKSPDAAATLPSPTGVDGIGIDNDLILDFRDFVEQSRTVRPQKIHTIPFMRHCLEEDVDPCMRFGSNPRVSSRRIVDAIVANTCFIEESPPGADKEQALNSHPPIRNSASKPMLWERLSGNPRIGCQCCGRIGPLPFQYRITNLDDWSLIDRYCRDRLVAVCEFYVFIRNIRQGLYNNRPTVDLYAECLRLRLQMFYARLGALPSMLNTLGIKSAELASAKKPSRTLSEVEESQPNQNDEEPEMTMVEEPAAVQIVAPPRESSLPNLNTPPDTPDDDTEKDPNSLNNGLTG